MPQALSALFCGLLLGSGLLVSGMTDPGDIERLQADVEAAVETFYRGWRPDAAG